VIEANFEGGDISSDGGLLLLRRADERIGLSRAAAAVLSDPRNPARITHGLRELLAQRIYGLCCGYEDLNGHDTLRSDLLMQTAVGRVDALASSPTLSRLETRATRAQAVALHGVLVEQFIASHKSPPRELVLDIDASDVPLHGAQERGEFHAYYDHHCYLPLYVFCGQAMLACVLRPSRIDGAKNAAAVIKLLVARLRQTWPEAKIIVRGDSGFCRQRLLRWCERSGVSYIVGLARNARLQATVQYAEAMLADEYVRTGVKQRLIDEFGYAADSWDIERRVITRLEYGAQGNNPRFVVTNLAGDAIQLYERLYCARGEGREPHQGSAARSVRHARELPALCGQPAAAAAGRAGLHADAQAAQHRACGQRTRTRHSGDDARAAAQDRRGCSAQHAPRARAAGLASPAARAVRAGRRTPGRRQPLNPIQCCLRHADKQRG
jgi:hypothetical protein